VILRDDVQVDMLVSTHQSCEPLVEVRRKRLAG
jgi:hypothetical protein